MSGYTTFSSIENSFTAPLENFISTGSSNLASAVAGPLALAVTLYVIITGVLMMLGKIDTPIREITLRVVKLGIIVALIKESGTYQKFVTDIFFDTLPKEITSALSAGRPLNGSSLDGLMTQVQIITTDILRSSGWGFSIITSSLAAVAVIVIALISMAVSFVVTLYAKIALTLVLALGPVFIACALFESTRRMTEAWFAQVINFVILQVLVVTLGSLLIDILGQQITEAASYAEALMIPVSLGATFVAAGYILYQLPQLASALAGGGMSLAYGTLARNDALGSSVAQSSRYVARRLSAAVGRRK